MYVGTYFMHFNYFSVKSIQVKNNINTFKNNFQTLLNTNFMDYESLSRLEFVSVIVFFCDMNRFLYDDFF
jgi:hypothetical protein